MSDTTIGIDLGTTYSAVAFVDERGQAKIIPNADGKKTTPSVVMIRDGRMEVGETALNRWVTDEEHVVRWIKRAMGDEDYRFQGRSAVEISAEILKVLKTDAEIYLGESVETAVITCPAYFNTLEIENTKKAGELAGLRVKEVVKEPTAAAVYYGIENMKDGEVVLVCDLGGGTYDATLLSYRNGVYTPLASMGSRELGGHDWTMELVDLVAERFESLYGEDPRNDLTAAQKLYEACEKAKRDFARLPALAIPCGYENRLEPIQVNREEFESRTEWRTGEMTMWSERALEKAGLKWNEIHKILLVGGSSRLRRMGEALEEISGMKPVATGEPDLMVALGAAILAKGKVRPRRPPGGLVEAGAGGLVDVEYRRIIARSLGTRIIEFRGKDPVIVNSLIIPHSTESPVSRSRDDYRIASDGQPFFDVPIVELEDDEEFDVIGNYRFHCLPGASRGDGVRVAFHYDESGIVSVVAEDLKSRRALREERLPYREPDLDEVVAVQVKPRWVVFAVDVSGSMCGQKIDNARRGVLENARQLLTTGDGQVRTGIVSFATKARVVCRPTTDENAVRTSVASLDPSGTTAMEEGIRLAKDLLLEAPADADRDLVLLTDGLPDRRDATLDAARDAARSGITLCILGVGSSDVDEKFLGSITSNKLVIDDPDTMGAAMTTLLTRAVKDRGGLTDA